MSIFLYGLVLLGSFTIALVVYVLAMIGWRVACTRCLPHSELRRPAVETTAVVLNLIPYSVSTIQYKKGVESTEPTHETGCGVCLTGFNDEECLQQLPHCRHLFHASCIDMWLYSHSDCPLCRTPVERLGDTPRVSLTIENSKDGLPDVRISS